MCIASVSVYFSDNISVDRLATLDWTYTSEVIHIH